MAEFERKNGKWVRNNSDGTQTQVTRGSDNRFYWTQPDGKKVKSKKAYKFKAVTKTKEDVPLWKRVMAGFVMGGNGDPGSSAIQVASGFSLNPDGSLEYSSDKSKNILAEWALSRSGGTNNIGGALLSIINNILPGNATRYYTGRIHTPIKYNNQKVNDRHGTSDLETKSYPLTKNYIRAATIGDFSGFIPSSTKGRYQNMSEYRGLPAVTDKFYTDTLYAPTASEIQFDRNLGKSYRLSSDSTLSNAKYKYIDGTYDARNHYITFNRDAQGQPNVFMEDVFNTNNPFVDKYLINPIIVNQTVPVQFTDDQEKLNRIPWLSNWFLLPRNIESRTQDSFNE